MVTVREKDCAGPDRRRRGPGPARSRVCSAARGEAVELGEPVAVVAAAGRPAPASWEFSRLEPRDVVAQVAAWCGSSRGRR